MVEMEHEVLPQRQRREKRRRPNPGPKPATDEERTGDGAELGVYVLNEPEDTTERDLEEEVADAAEAVLRDQLEEGLMIRREGLARGRAMMGMGEYDEGGEGGEEAEVLTSAPDREINYEYMDHTADIQLHSWGSTLEEAFEGAALAMFNYMVRNFYKQPPLVVLCEKSPLVGVQVNERLTHTYEAQAHDMQSMLFAFLDEFLFVFSTELFIPCDIRITSFDRESWTITATGRGEKFSLEKHEQGTEVKAITYSAMQITETPERSDICVIVDI